MSLNIVGSIIFIDYTFINYPIHVFNTFEMQLQC